MNADSNKLIRKTVGAEKQERPLVRLDRLNRSLRRLKPEWHHEPGLYPIRKTVGRPRPG